MSNRCPPRPTNTRTLQLPLCTLCCRRSYSLPLRHANVLPHVFVHSLVLVLFVPCLVPTRRSTEQKKQGRKDAVTQWRKRLLDRRAKVAPGAPSSGSAAASSSSSSAKPAKEKDKDVKLPEKFSMDAVKPYLPPHTEPIYINHNQEEDRIRVFVTLDGVKTSTSARVPTYGLRAAILWCLKFAWRKVNESRAEPLHIPFPELR